MSLNTEHMGMDELREAMLVLEKEIRSREQAGKQIAIAKINELAKAHNLDVVITERDGTRRSRHARSDMPVAFRNPENKNQTWVGRGKRPHWLVALLSEGHSMEEYRVA